MIIPANTRIFSIDELNLLNVDLHLSIEKQHLCIVDQHLSIEKQHLCIVDQHLSIDNQTLRIDDQFFSINDSIWLLMKRLSYPFITRQIINSYQDIV